MALSAAQTTDMLADLAAGDIDDVFSQVELDRLYERAGSDYNLAVYYGWRQIYAESSKWVDYAVAQTKVSRSQAATQIEKALKLWADESRTTANQLVSAGLRGIPTKHKPQPADEGRSGYFRRGRWIPYANG